ncbi:MAG: hypothetical protein AB1696_16440 [Planctomycetota bacterium]
MNRDPIVEEIHRVRQKIWDECGGDMKKFLERLKARESEDRDRIITLSEFKKLTGKDKPAPKKE